MPPTTGKLKKSLYLVSLLLERQESTLRSLLNLLAQSKVVSAKGKRKLILICKPCLTFAKHDLLSLQCNEAGCHDGANQGFVCSLVDMGLWSLMICEMQMMLCMN